jgi:hypothetical protein
MSNGTDPLAPMFDPLAVSAPLTFPTWPPPSGGAPVTAWELGPIVNPFPYGTTQPANISTAPPAPLKKATYFPQGMPPKSGQNQPQTLPAWPHAKFNVLPDKASPALSKLP